MRLLKKVLLVSAGLGAFLMSVDWYYGHYRRDYYFPDRYEDAFAAMFYAIVVSVIVLVATVAAHFIGLRRPRK